MDLDIFGKRVLVTGSSQGIGLAIAEGFHEEGCIVVSNGRNKNTLDSSIADRQNWFGLAGDVTDPNEARNLVDQAKDILGGLDILICNVGSGRSVPPGTEQFSDWEKSLSENLFSATNVTSAAISALVESSGAIVCTSSICGMEVIPGAPVTYSASKAALNAFIRGAAIPLGKQGVRINGVAPGNIYFEGSVWEEKSKKDPSEVRNMLQSDIPLRRFGSTKDVTNLVLWLSSPLSAFTTGSVYVSDGGQLRS